MAWLDFRLLRRRAGSLAQAGGAGRAHMIWWFKFIARGDKLCFNVFGDEERLELTVLLGRYVFVLTGTHVVSSFGVFIRSEASLSLLSASPPPGCQGLGRGASGSGFATPGSPAVDRERMDKARPGTTGPARKLICRRSARQPRSARRWFRLL